MTETTKFYIWFYDGLGGLGGWIIFFLFALAAVVWIFYDSSKRNLPVLGWRLGATLLSLLLIPAIIFRFASLETKASLGNFTEAIFYLGLLGGILPVVLAVGYYVTYKGLVGCRNGHIYEEVLGQCPECSQPVARQDNFQQDYYAPTPPPPMPVPGPVIPQRPIRQKVNAWLVDQNGRNYQLCQGDTTIGRSSSNDIQFSGVSSISRQHAKIQEKNGRYYLSDLASGSGTKVNGKYIQQTLLEPNDQIQFSDNVVVTFVTTN